VVDGSGEVSEHILAVEGAKPTKTPLPPSVTVLSKSTERGRTVVWLKLPTAGMGVHHFSYEKLAASSTLPIVLAAGSTPQLAYHS
jgi:hypothetical protein